MIPLIYFMTALVSLLGGMVILSRSGASHGRSFACGLLCIAGSEGSYLLFYLRESLAAIRVASLFELCSIVCFIVAVVSMERSMAKKTRIILWTRRSLTVA